MARKKATSSGNRIGTPGSTGPPPDARPDGGGGEGVVAVPPEGPAGAALAPAFHPVDLQALHLRETATAMYLYGSSAGTFPKVETAAFSRYVQKLREDAGDPADPVEQMLVEQLALAHHAVGRLHLKAATAETLNEAAIFLGAAARLTAEFRKTALALKSYREPAAAPHVAVIQQNGAGGEQKIAMINGADVPGPRRLECLADTELEGKAGEPGHDRAQRVA
jgi:hypothetical protein